MSVFQTFTKVFNRAPEACTVTFDGQQYTIEPGHDRLPDVTVLYAKNQNPIMGSQDPNNPHVSGGRYLIVTEDEEGYGVPMTAEEWAVHLSKPSRLDMDAIFEEKYARDPGARMVILGRGKKSTASSRYEAGGNPGGRAAFSGKD